VLGVFTFFQTFEKPTNGPTPFFYFFPNIILSQKIGFNAFWRMDRSAYMSEMV
jgi:hypothetical protein